MRSLLLIGSILLWAAFPDGFAQNLEQVPLQKEGLHLVEPDSARIDRLWRIAFHYSQIYPDSGLTYALEAISLAIKSHNQRGLAESANIAGLCFSNIGNYEEAEKKFSQAIGIISNINDACLSAAVLGNRGWNFYHQHNFTDALAQFFEAEQLDRQCPTRGWKSTSYYNIGVAYNALQEYEKALPYFEQAISQDLQSGDSTKLATSIQGKANALRDLGRITEAKQHYQMALNLYARLTDKYAEAYVYENLAQLELEQANYSQAIDAAQKALNIFRQLQRKQDEQYELGLLAKILMHSGKITEAEIEAGESLRLAQELNDPHARKDAYALLSEIYEKNNDFRRALQFIQLENALRDSLNEVEELKSQAELAVRYETEKKDRMLERERMLSAEAKHEKTLWLLGSLVAILVATLIALRLYQSRKTEKFLQKKNQQIDSEKERAVRSEKSKELFLSTMSHELRNPLSALQGILRLFNTEKLSEKDYNFVFAMKDLSAHMQRVVDDVLETAQLDAGQLVIQPAAFMPFEAIKSLSDVYTTLASDKRLGFRCECHFPEKLVLLGDKSRMLQILHNLLSNALKFTQIGQIELQVSYESGSLIAVVQDQGPGISETLRQRLFEPFEQAERKQGSSGLGLSISKRIARLMNGDLVILSGENEGACFKMTIPMPETDSLIQKEIASAEKYNDAKGHILVVEDDPYAFVVSKNIIQNYFPSATVYHFHDAQGVVDEIKADDYDLILLDIHLPGISGAALCKQLRGMGCSLPIYAFTAAVTPSEVEEYMRCGMTGVIPKPFTDQQLVSAIAKHIGKTESHDDLSPVAFSGERSLLLSNYLPYYLNLADSARKNGDRKALGLCFHSIGPFLLDCGLPQLAEEAKEMEVLCKTKDITEQRFHEWVSALQNMLYQNV